MARNSEKGRWYRKTKLKIVHKSLARYRHRKTGKRCLGYWQRPGLIWIEKKHNRRSYADTLIHEMLHDFAPEWSENRVRRTANKINAVLWKLGIEPTRKIGSWKRKQ